MDAEGGAEVSIFEGALNKEGGVAGLGGCSTTGPSSLSSMDSAGGLVFAGDDTISSSDVSKPKSPPEGFSGFGASFTALPSPLNVDPS